MATKTTRSSIDRDQENLTGQAALTEQTRHQLTDVAETTSVMYRAAESLQQIHQQLTQRVALRHQQMTERLREANSPADLMTIQATLLTSGIQEAAQYWQDLAAAGLKIQADLMDQMNNQRQNSSSGFAGMPVLQAWQNAFVSPADGHQSPVVHH